MSRESAIKVKNLIKNFGKDENIVRVIEDASFEIQKGEVVALIAQVLNCYWMLVYLLDYPGAQSHDCAQAKLKVLKGILVGRLGRNHNVLSVPPTIHTR